jgi:hypothetical protein
VSKMLTQIMTKVFCDTTQGFCLEYEIVTHDLQAGAPCAPSQWECGS